jgi:predicted RNA-binding Zn ribbon-like protein
LEKELQERYVKFERFDLDGGHPVLDFTNTTDTVEWRGTGKDDDYLGDYLDLLAWCHRTGYLPEQAIRELARYAAQHPQEAAEALGKARELREAVFGLLHAWLKGQPPPAELLSTFNRHLRQAMAKASLRVASAPGQRYAYALELDLEHDARPLERVALRLAQQAADLLTSLDTARLKICSNPRCGWLFLDTSRNASRRWCNMAACGNRAKARRFYSKRKKSRPAGPLLNQ